MSTSIMIICREVGNLIKCIIHSRTTGSGQAMTGRHTGTCGQRGEQSHNSLRFVIGALVLNRVASAIDAARLAAAYRKMHHRN